MDLFSLKEIQLMFNHLHCPEDEITFDYVVGREGFLPPKA